MYCKKCGAQNADAAKFCTSCGASTTDTVLIKTAEGVYEKVENKRRSGLGIPAMICGIMSAVISCIPFGCVFSWALAIPGLLCGVIGILVKHHFGKCLTGLIMSVFSLIVCAVAYYFYYQMY